MSYCLFWRKATIFMSRFDTKVVLCKLNLVSAFCSNVILIPILLISYFQMFLLTSNILKARVWSYGKYQFGYFRVTKIKLFLQNKTFALGQFLKLWTLLFVYTSKFIPRLWRWLLKYRSKKYKNLVVIMECSDKVFILSHTETD